MRAVWLPFFAVFVSWAGGAIAQTPTILSFTATPTVIDIGDSTTLMWSVSGGDSISIPDLGFSSTDLTGSVAAAPLVSTSYRLGLFDQGVEVDAQAVAVIVLAPRFETFEVSPSTIAEGQSATLSWSTTLADSITIEPLGFSTSSTSGSIQISPDVTTTYVGRIYLEGVPVNTAEAQLTVVPPFIVSFTATPNPFVPGDATLLQWSTASGDSITIDPIGYSDTVLDGSLSVEPSGPTTYTLSLFFGGAVTDTQDLLVNTRDPEILFFAAIPPAAIPGSTINLNWNVTEVDSVVIEPIGFRSIQASGSTSTILTEETTYTLNAFYNDFHLTQSTVATLVYLIYEFSSDPSVIPFGSSSTLTWSVSPCDSITIEPGGFSSTELDGTLLVQPTETTLYQLKQWAGGVVRKQQNRQIAVAQAQVVSFEADRSTVFAGEPVRVSWEVFPPDAIVHLEGQGPLPVVGSLTIYPIVSGNIELHVDDGEFTTTSLLPITVNDPAPDGEAIHLVRDPVFLEPLIDPVPVGTLFDIYAVTLNASTPFNGFAFRLELPPCMVLVSAEYVSGGTRTTSLPDHVVTLSLCEIPDPIEVLAHFQVLAFGAPGDPCLESPHLVTPDPPQSVGSEFGLLDCFTNQTVFFDWAQGIQLGDPATALPDQPEVVPTEDAILSATPNPFNPRTVIRFAVTQPGEIGLAVYDLAGRQVRRESVRVEAPGVHTWTWEGRDAADQPAASGVYFVRLSTATGESLKKVTLLK